MDPIKFSKNIKSLLPFNLPKLPLTTYSLPNLISLIGGVKFQPFNFQIQIKFQTRFTSLYILFFYNSSHKRRENRNRRLSIFKRNPCQAWSPLRSRQKAQRHVNALSTHFLESLWIISQICRAPPFHLSFRDILKQLEERLSLSSKDLMRRANDAFEIGSFARVIHKVEARATRIIEISFSLSLPFSLHPLFQASIRSWKHLIKILPLRRRECDRRRNCSLSATRITFHQRELTRNIQIILPTSTAV